MTAGRPRVKLQPVHLVRWGLPLGLVVAGVIVLFAVDADGVGESLIAAGLCVWIANALLRFGFRDSGDREREERAREFYDEHGHWPDDPPR
jgi:hypothetical protein